MEDGYVAVACMSLADGRIPSGIAGAWLVWYDPAGNDGTGDAGWSHDPADAARFTSEEWAELYTAVPANRLVRPDGKPNRPITMFSLMIVPVDPGRLPSILPEVGGSPPMTDAEFMAELDRMVAEAEAHPPSPPERPPPREIAVRTVPEDGPDAGDTDRRVMIMCDVRASGITGEVDDSYFVRVEQRESGGITVLWSDLPEQAMVFDDAAAAEEFCRDSPLEMFVVSFVPVSGPPGPAVESEADFLARLDRMVAEAGEPRRAPAPAPEPPPAPREEDPEKPDLSQPGALSESLRRMGLM